MTVTCARCDCTASGADDALPAGWESQVSTMSNATFLVCGTCAEKSPAAKSTGNVAEDQLRLLIERVERVEEEIKGAQDDRKDIYQEAKATGYDVKVMKEIVRQRRMPGHALAEFSAVLETYKCALGME